MQFNYGCCYKLNISRVTKTKATKFNYKMHIAFTSWNSSKLSGEVLSVQENNLDGKQTADTYSRALDQIQMPTFNKLTIC